MDAPLNPGQARVVDPVLTNVARGYRNAMHCWPYLFPPVSVAQRGGQVIEFGAEEFAKVNIRRSPGANRQQIQFGHSGAPYVLQQRALDGKVPREIMEESMAVPGINYSTVAVRKTMSIVSLQIEIHAAETATTPGTYDAGNHIAVAAGSRWDKDDVSPAKQVEAAKERIAVGIGMDPNVLIVGVSVHRALLNNSDVIDRIKHTQGLTGASAPVVTDEMLAQYFNVDMYKVGRARTGRPGEFTPLWGKVAVLAYSEVSSLADMGSPSYGYTYQLEGYPIAEPGYFNREVDSWLYPVTTEATPVVAGKAGGYLFTTVVD